MKMNNIRTQMSKEIKIITICAQNKRKMQDLTFNYAKIIK